MSNALNSSLPPSIPPAGKEPALSLPKGNRLLNQARDALRTKHYSYRTEETCLDWDKTIHPLSP